MSSSNDCEIYTYIAKTPKKRKISAYKYRENFFKSENKTRRSVSNNSTDIFSYRSISIILILLQKTSPRKDFYGTPITKESRKHKVTFKDEIKRGELVDISMIKETDNLPCSKKYIINRKPRNEEDLIVYSSNKVNSSKEEGEKVVCQACIIF